LVSKKLSGISLVPVEPEVVREASAKSMETLQQFFSAGLARHSKLAPVADMDLDFIPFVQLQRLYHGGRQAKSQTVTPFCDTHCISPGYTFYKKYIV
jgi:hypothetical protein